MGVLAAREGIPPNVLGSRIQPLGCPGLGISGADSEMKDRKDTVSVTFSSSNLNMQTDHLEALSNADANSAGLGWGRDAALLTSSGGFAAAGLGPHSRRFLGDPPGRRSPARDSNHTRMMIKQQQQRTVAIGIMPRTLPPFPNLIIITTPWGCCHCYFIGKETGLRS